MANSGWVIRVSPTPNEVQAQFYSPFSGRALALINRCADSLDFGSESRNGQWDVLEISANDLYAQNLADSFRGMPWLIVEPQGVRIASASETPSAPGSEVSVVVSPSETASRQKSEANSVPTATIPTSEVIEKIKPPLPPRRPLVSTTATGDACVVPPLEVRAAGESATTLAPSATIDLRGEAPIPVQAVLSDRRPVTASADSSPTLAAQSVPIPMQESNALQQPWPREEILQRAPRVGNSFQQQAINPPRDFQPGLTSPSAVQCIYSGPQILPPLPPRQPSSFQRPADGQLPPQLPARPNPVPSNVPQQARKRSIPAEGSRFEAPPQQAKIPLDQSSIRSDASAKQSAKKNGRVRRVLRHPYGQIAVRLSTGLLVGGALGSQIGAITDEWSGVEQGQSGIASFGAASGLLGDDDDDYDDDEDDDDDAANYDDNVDNGISADDQNLSQNATSSVDFNNDLTNIEVEGQDMVNAAEMRPDTVEVEEQVPQDPSLVVPQ